MTQAINTEQWFTRSELPELFEAHGVPMSAATLASRVTRLGGPPFRINNRKAEYWGTTALEWRKSLLKYRGAAVEQQVAA
jgi:hypothetical protein